MTEYYPLIVAQYAIEGHPRRTEHWSLVALESQRIGHVFELVGNLDTFAYVPKSVSRFGYSTRLRGGCRVGSIARDKLDWLKETLNEVIVVRNNPDFDCQTWVIDALRLVKGSSGVEISNVSERGIREELIQEKERWEQAEPTIEERLYAN
jgi:hypothetical protein